MGTRVKLLLAVALVGGTIGAAEAMPAAATEASTSTTAATAVESDWCAVGEYNESLKRCCVYMTDGCTYTGPPLPRPHVFDPSSTLSTGLSGAEQSETSAGDPDGSGSITLQLDPFNSQVCFSLSTSGFNRSPGLMGHVHLGARGANGPPVIDIFEEVNPPSSFSRCRNADPQTIRDMRNNPGGYYIQLHNVEYPLGVVRGQLGD